MSVPSRPVDRDILHAISMHYFAEAHLLQERCHREWLEQMVAPDIEYWMPILEQRLLRDRRPEPTMDDAAIFNDRYKDLHGRVERLYTGQVWMEDPPSRIRYFINNVEAFETGTTNEFHVRSNVLVIRHRRQTEVAQHSLGRTDLLRRDGESFRVARRRLDLDARVVQDKNLYFFA